MVHGETFGHPQGLSIQSIVRAGLSHPLRERRASRRRHSRHASKGKPHGVLADVPAREAPDLAVLRVREAGGPVDRASYSCECGYVFAAKVSTSVCCPVCGTGQAW
jgi:rubrerythrin